MTTAGDEASTLLEHETLYDDVTERRIDAAARRRRTVRRAGSGRQALGGGALLTAVALGLQEVFDPVDREAVVREVPTGEPDADAPVDLLLVPGAPRRSRARVRPWLLS